MVSTLTVAPLPFDITCWRVLAYKVEDAGYPDPELNVNDFIEFKLCSISVRAEIVVLPIPVTCASVSAIPILAFLT